MVNLRSPGLWLLLAGLEMLFLVHISEFLYSGYSVSEDYISELGVGPTASRTVFTIAVIAFGLMALVAAALFRQRDRKSLIWLLLGLSGAGAIGVGAFNMDDFSAAHFLAAFMAFLFGNFAVLYSYKMVRAPISWVFALLGLIGLSALVLMGGGVDFGLGIGGMERLILYPAMFWAVGFGAYLLADESRMSAG